MPERITDVTFEDLVLDYGLRVWCDLTIHQLRNIEGVVKVSQMDEGYYGVIIDKRYSKHEVKSEIWRLAGYVPIWFGILGYRKNEQT